MFVVPVIKYNMKKKWSLIFSLFLFCAAQAQYKVRFIVSEETAFHHDSIYITGTFSNWDSTANKTYLMQPLGINGKSITLNIKAGILKYKFHRGGWAKVEKQFSGDEVPDRVVDIKWDTVLTDSVLSWRDEMLADKWYQLAQKNADTTRAKILAAIASTYAFLPEYYNSDSALYYAQKAFQLQQKIMASDDYKLSSAPAYTANSLGIQEIIATLLHSLGNYHKSLEIRFGNLKMAENHPDKFIMMQTLKNITEDYIAMKDYQNVLYYGRLMDSILYKQNGSDPRFSEQEWVAKNIIATAFYKLGRLDSALFYAKKMTAIKLDGVPHQIGTLAFGDLLLADIYNARGDISQAFLYYRQVIVNAAAIYAFQLCASAQAGIARLFLQQGRPDSALLYARQALTFFQNNKTGVQSWGQNTDGYIAEISPLLAELYKANGQLDSAYKYLRLSVTLKDSLYNTDKIRQFQTLGFNEASRRQQLEQQSREAKQQYENRVKIYSLVAGMAAFLILAFILYRNNKQKQKANTLLQTQKQEIEATLGELKNTQRQLIQSEKMASLGELTAGIAHEIQNPLNFVNNFSEVSNELVDEMNEELSKGDIEEAKAIAYDIKQNLKKINHHGKRADAIVKGMLQHSRSSSATKEPTDINKLADEYLRLAYHGLRAKDKLFNAVLKTDYDESIGSINIVPQDMGRVILNLITNAFYAVTALSASGGEKAKPKQGYEPTVWVSTKKTEKNVLISVKDNGSGISQKLLDKIFQPFFTTKPTGQGTGLGLSLAYDIVKAHGGVLKVETKEGEGSTFTIQLPA